MRGALFKHLQLGDDVAKGLGVNVELVRLVFTAIGALLAASAVSVAGLLGFVGLIVPHTVRLLTGSDYRFFNSVVCTFGHSRCNLQRYAGPCGFCTA